MVLRKKKTTSCEQMPETPQIKGIGWREEAFMLNLLAPRRGERFLDVGFDVGERSLLFRDLGCDVTVVAPSLRMLEIAKQRLGQKAASYLAKPEELPFCDNEFDIVSLVLSLEFAEDPAKAISEAIRVCRGRVFLGVINKYSLADITPGIKELIGDEYYRNARFFNVSELMSMVRLHLPLAAIHWGSVICLPCRAGKIAAALDKIIPVRKNPFGAFLGLSFNVTCNLRTLQDVIGSSFQLEAKEGQPARGVVRESQVKCRSSE